MNSFFTANATMADRYATGRGGRAATESSCPTMAGWALRLGNEFSSDEFSLNLNNQFEQTVHCWWRLSVLLRTPRSKRAVERRG